MSVIFTATHEVGNLTEYTTTSGADISVAAGAALVGSYGMNVLQDDATPDYAYKTLSPANTSGKARARFYVDPNGISISAGGFIQVSMFYNTSAPIGIVRLLLVSGNYTIEGIIVDDAGGYHAATDITISDAPHYIEYYLTRAATNVSSDGTISIWVDGSNLQSATGIDNYDRFNNLTYITLGARVISGTISGTFYCDDIVVNDDGSLIGGVGKPKNFMFYKRMRQSHVA